MNTYLMVALVIFSASLLLSHLPILWVKYAAGGRRWLDQYPKEWKRYWELVDYFWLSIAALSLLTLPNEFQRLVRNNELDIEVGRFYWDDVGAFIDDAERYLSYYEDDPSFDESSQWFADARDTASDGLAEMRDGLAQIDEGEGREGLARLARARAHFDGFIASHSDTAPEIPSPYDSSQVLRMFQENSDHAALVERLYWETQVGESEEYLRFISPYMLAIALGIRLAKVTAKVAVDA